MTYELISDGDWVEPTPQRGHAMACCDCGLVHFVNFRVRKGRVQFQAFRDELLTVARRAGLAASGRARAVARINPQPSPRRKTGKASNTKRRSQPR